MNEKYIWLGAGVLIGAAIGVAGSYGYFKNHFQKIADEEIQSVKEVYSEGSRHHEEIDIPEDDDNLDTSEEVSDNYEQLVEEYAGKEHPTDEIEGPRRIMREEFVENTRHYDQDTVTYYPDENLLVNDLTNEPVDDIDGTVGQELMEMFAESTDDEWYIRNDRTGQDFEVLKSYLSSGFYVPSDGPGEW